MYTSGFVCLTVENPDIHAQLERTISCNNMLQTERSLFYCQHLRWWFFGVNRVHYESERSFSPSPPPPTLLPSAATPITTFI